MDPNHDHDNQDNFAVEVDDSAVSIEDFIRQLELRERDLHISSDLSIEIDDAGFDDTNPEFIRSEFDFKPVTPIEPARPSAPRNDVPDTTTFSDLECELEALRSKLEKSEADKAEMVTAMRRRQFDFDNYRKRTERERGETFLNQLASLATQMLPVIDNLDRALDFAAKHAEGKSNDFQEFHRGIVLVSQQLNEVLVEMGVVPIASVGEPFDPNFHEAVAAEQNGSFRPNTITAEMLRGYRVGDKVIRAAMVRVAVAPQPAPDTTAIQPDQSLEVTE
jgi:molecular chaperone GrpE (heat shock protein)